MFVRNIEGPHPDGAPRHEAESLRIGNRRRGEVSLSLRGSEVEIVAAKPRGKSLCSQTAGAHGRGKHEPHRDDTAPHPVGATGTRLVLTVLRELRRRGLNRGLATLCVGGGQGAALALEAA